MPKGATGGEAVSKKQRRMMAIAEHEPEKLYKRNRAVLKMDKADRRAFAKTKEKVGSRELPARITRDYVKKRLGKRK